MNQYTDKRILVSGGCGSIGSHLVGRLLQHEPHSIRVLDTNEEALFHLQHEFPGHSDKLRFLIGDIRDRARLEMAMENIDVVFHAAALKHVELNEYNPFEAVQTNVQGTQNMLRIAREEEVETFVGISTDKASNPASVMGATKLLAERLTVAANAYKGRRPTRFACVRFGNVLGASGSVVPLFIDQIEEGGPITVTQPEMTRFIMPVDRAGDLVLQAGERLEGGEVYVLKMPAFRLGTLAKAVKERYAPAFGYEPGEIETRTMGPRPGERLHEKLISQDESTHTEEFEDMFVVRPEIDFEGYKPSDGVYQNSLDGEYASNHVPLLSEPEIIELIEQTDTVSGDR